HAVHRRELELAADRAHVAEVALHRSERLAEARQPLAAALDRRRVGVDPHERPARLRPFEDRFRVPAAAERAVEIAAAGADVQRGEHFIQHNGDVAGIRRHHRSRVADRSAAAGYSSATRTASPSYSSGFHSSRNSPVPVTSTFPESRAYSRSDAGMRIRFCPSISTVWARWNIPRRITMARRLSAGSAITSCACRSNASRG